jgi:hypothetical protein
MMAKRAATAAGLMGAGAATAYGASALLNNDEGGSSEETAAELNENDLVSGASAGALDEQTTEQSTPDTTPVEEPPVRNDYEVSEHSAGSHHEEKPEVEPELQFESNTHIYDENHNLVAEVDEGTYDGKSFAIADVDADGHGDLLMYDANGNGVYEENEVALIDGYDYAMGSGGGAQHNDVFIDTGDYTMEPNDDLAGIDNDYVDYSGAKDGVEYQDLAEVSDDYQNDADVEHYAAGDDHTYDLDGTDAYESYTADASDEYNADPADEYAVDDYNAGADHDMAYDDTPVDDPYDVV